MNVTRSMWSRIVAACVAALLSGAPTLAGGAAAAVAPPARQGCSCHHARAGAPCNCPGHAAARNVKAKKAPCCHRHGADKAPQAPRTTVTCAAGCCGGAPEARLASPGGTEPFVLEREPSLPTSRESGRVLLAGARALAAERAPDVPPPRE